jgi:hypothetical protein
MIDINLKGVLYGIAAALPVFRRQGFGRELAELCADNLQLTRSLRSTHEVSDQHYDVATASLLEVWVDETERRTCERRVRYVRNQDRTNLSD